jgi:hypothetical protein
MFSPPETGNKDLDAFLYQVYLTSTDNDTATRLVEPGSGQPVQFPFQYLYIKYADTYLGVGISDTPTDKTYWGVANSNAPIESIAPSAYIWTQQPVGFLGKSVFYINLGSRIARFYVGATAPTVKWIADSGPAIDLDIVVLSNTVTDADINVGSLELISTEFDGGNITNSTMAGANITSSTFDGGAVTGSVISTSVLNGDVVGGANPYLDFTPTTTQPYAEGRVFYDQGSHSLAYQNEVSNVTVNLGREVLVRVYNNTGVTILNGKVAYTSGSFGDSPKAALAIASSAIQADAVLGIATHDIPNATHGYLTTLGLVNELNTLVDSEGNVPGLPGLPVYLSATVPGGFTFVPPLQPNFQVRLGQVANDNVTTGSIYTRVTRLPWYPSLEVVDTRSGIVLPTTPTVFAMNTSVYNNGFTYNSTTGEFLFLESGTFTFNLMINATASASNKQVNYYAEFDTGAGYVIQQYSGRRQELINNTPIQLVIASSRYIAVNTKARFYLWADATVTLNSVNLPGTTAGTVVVPAARLTLA